MTISFKGAHFPEEVILYAVFFYLRFGVSYRDLEEIMAERGVELDHATLNRWVSRYAGLFAGVSQYKKRPANRSWRMDETFIKVNRSENNASRTSSAPILVRTISPKACRVYAGSGRCNIKVLACLVECV